MCASTSTVDQILCFYPDGPNIIVMIAAYLDESGIHEGAPICVIAGYWGKAKTFRAFSRGWVKTLKKFGLPLEDFHAKNARAAGPAGLLDALAHTISAYEIYPVSAGISIPDFNSFPLNDRKFMTGAVLDCGKLVSSGCPSKPYFVPFQMIVKSVTKHAPDNGKAHFFFGLDRPFAGYATTLLDEFKQARETWEWKDKDKLGIPAFPLAKETAPLQAADLLVHLTYVEMKDALARGQAKIAPSKTLGACLKNILSAQDHNWQNKAELLGTLERSKRIYQQWYPNGVLSPVTAPSP